jgi:hypothetical protein
MGDSVGWEMTSDPISLHLAIANLPTSQRDTFWNDTCIGRTRPNRKGASMKRPPYSVLAIAFILAACSSSGTPLPSQRDLCSGDNCKTQLGPEFRDAGVSFSDALVDVTVQQPDTMATPDGSPPSDVATPDTEPLTPDAAPVSGPPQDLSARISSTGGYTVMFIGRNVHPSARVEMRRPGQTKIIATRSIREFNHQADLTTFTIRVDCPLALALIDTGLNFWVVNPGGHFNPKPVFVQNTVGLHPTDPCGKS